MQFCKRGENGDNRKRGKTDEGEKQKAIKKKDKKKGKRENCTEIELARINAKAEIAKTNKSNSLIKKMTGNTSFYLKCLK